MKTKVLFLATVALLGLGSNSMLHAQVELDANFPASQPHDATWSASSSGYNLAWSNLSKKLALTSNTNTLTLKDNCNFGNADEVTMHLTYELDTELPDGYQIFTPKAELKNAVGGETIVNLRQARSKSHERTMDLTIDKSIVGGLENIQRIFIQSNHTGDNGGAMYVTDVSFDTPMGLPKETAFKPFSAKTTTGNVYLFENLPAGTFTGATNIDLVMSNLFDAHQNEAFEVWATINGGDDVNITPGKGDTKWSLPGNLVCYLNNVNVNDITGIYLKPKCTIGFATFDVSIRVSNGGTLIRESDTKTFNARTDNMTVNFYSENQPAGTFRDASKIRLTFNDFNAYGIEGEVSGGIYEVLAIFSDNSTKRLALPTTVSALSDNGEGKMLTIDLPSEDRANIVNFRLVQKLTNATQGDANFKFTVDFPRGFSSRLANGDLYLFENENGTFANATKIEIVMTNIFDSRTRGGRAFDVYAKYSDNSETLIFEKYSVPGELTNGNINNLANKSDITGIFFHPRADNGYLTFDASIKVYNGNTLIKESETKTFNARTSADAITYYLQDKPAGSFTDAERIRLNFTDYSERNVSEGGRYRVRAKLSDESTPEIATLYGSGSDNNAGVCKTLDIPADLDKSQIVNFIIEPLRTTGEINFYFSPEAIDTDTSVSGDGFGDGGITSNKVPYLTLYKDFGSYTYDLETATIADDTWPNASFDKSTKTLSWTGSYSNFEKWNIPSELNDLTDAKIFIKTSAASNNPQNSFRLRLEGNSTSDWVTINGYGEHYINVNDISNLPTNATLIVLGGSGDGSLSPGSIVIEELAIVRDHAILGEVTPKYPLNLIKNPGYADYVNSSDWESNNTLTWTQYYGNQIYLAWPNNTDISDLTKFESIRLQSNVGTSGAASSYRLMVYYGDEVANDNNIKNYYSTTISSSDATINLATLFKNNTAAMQNVKNIAIAGDGNNGSCQFTRISLIRKNDAASFTMTPINGTDLVKFRQLNTNVSKTYATNVEYAPEFVLNDNTVITAEETFTPTANSYSEQIAHFNINEMLTDEQISQVKNVRIRITSYDDAQIDFSRIYLSDRITLEWDKYLKSTLDNSELRIPSTIENLFSKDWDTYLIPIYTEDLTDLKRITVEAVSSTKSSFDCVIVLDDEATNAEEGNIRIENGTYPNNRYDFDASSFGTVTLIKVKFKVEDNVTFNKLILYKSLPIYAEEREDLAVTDMTYYRADDNTYYHDTYHTQIADVVMGTSTPVVFGEVGATYVGRDGDIQSYYIMDSNDNFLTVDQPAENKRYDLIHTHGTKLHKFGDNSYILESNTRPSGYADLSDYSELRIWKDYTSTASTNNNDAPVRVFFVANTRDLTGYLTVDSVGTNFPLLVTERYCSVDLDEVKKLCNGKAYLIGIKGMNSSAAPTVTNVSVYKTKANYVLGGDMIEGSNAENCITNALADVNATYIDATDVSTTNNYTLPRDPANPNCLIYTTNSHLIGKNVICNGKATGDITLSYGKDFYAPYDVDMDGHTVSYTANISDNLSTLVLPFSTTIPEATDLRVYTVYASIDEGTTYVEAHQMTPGTTLPANTPVLIRVPEGGSASRSWTFEGTSIEATPFVMKNEGFVGTYTAQRAPGSGSGYRTYNPYVKTNYDSYDWGTPELVPNRYVLQKVNGNFIFNSVNRDEAGNMYKPKMKGFRCWLVSDNDLVNAASHTTEQNNAKAFIRFFDVDATNIKCVTETPEDKTASKGIFNLQGQRLTNPQKGFNIINGKVIYNK